MDVMGSPRTLLLEAERTLLQESEDLEKSKLLLALIRFFLHHMVLLQGTERSSQGLRVLAMSLLMTQDCLCAVSWWLSSHQLKHSHGK